MHVNIQHGFHEPFSPTVEVHAPEIASDGDGVYSADVVVYPFGPWKPAVDGHPRSSGSARWSFEIGEAEAFGQALLDAAARARAGNYDRT